jgi:hypothetical protein
MPEKVTYTGATDEQVKWGSCADPRGVLTVGSQYDVERYDVHDWHTKIQLAGVDGWFNSVCFDSQ